MAKRTADNPARTSGAKDQTRRRFGRRKKAPGSRRERLNQIRQAFTLTRQHDPKLVPILVGVVVVVLAVMIALGVIFGQVIYLTVLGVLLAVLAATLVFGRRASASAFRQVEGEPGAAAAVLQSMRGNWRVQPAIAFTSQQDFVHRVVGRPGVILVGEGAPHRVRNLLSQEKKKAGRVVGQVPVYDLIVGDDEGQVPLRKLNRHVTKLPRNIKAAEVNTLDRRLIAIGGAKMPIPKGPVPQRVPRGKIR